MNLITVIVVWRPGCAEDGEFVACLQSVLGQENVSLNLLVVSPEEAVLPELAETAIGHFSAPAGASPELMRQMGLRVAEGDYVLFLDAGSRLMAPNVLSELLRYLQQSGADFTYAPSQTDGGVVQPEMACLPYRSPCSLNTMLMRRSTACRLKGFETDRGAAASFDFMLQLFMSGASPVFVPVVVDWQSARVVGQEASELARARQMWAGYADAVSLRLLGQGRITKSFTEVAGCLLHPLLWMSFLGRLRWCDGGFYVPMSRDTGEAVAISRLQEHMLKQAASSGSASRSWKLLASEFYLPFTLRTYGRTTLSGWKSRRCCLRLLWVLPLWTYEMRYRGDRILIRHYLFGCIPVLSLVNAFARAEVARCFFV